MRSLSRTMVFAGILLALGPLAAAQTGPATRPSGLVRLTFPENVELKTLAEYVSQRLGINILYDEQVGAKRITIKAPAELPADSLLGLFQSALRMKGLALVDGEQPGWKKIVAGQDLLSVTRTIVDGAAPLPAERTLDAVTAVVRLRHISPQAAEQLIKPFLSQPGGNSLAVPDQSLLIVTDYAGNFSRLSDLIRLADQPGPEVAVRFVQAANVEAGRLAQDAARVLSERAKQASTDKRAAAGLPTILSLGRAGQVVVIGTAGQVAEAVALLQSLDVPSDTVTKVYQFEAVSPERVERLAKELVDPDVIKTAYRSVADKEAGILVVSAPPAVHEKIEALKKELDVLMPAQAAPVRFYRLTNTTAAEVLSTIQSLRQGKEPLAAAVAAMGKAEAVPLGVMPSPPGANRPPPEPGQELPKPPAYREEPASRPSEAAAPAGPPALRAMQTEDATVAADANTNTIIVVAPPPVQKVYEQLIKMLDKRRPQVLVEVTLVTLDTSGGFSLGVELMYESRDSKRRYLTFGAFGLSTVDAAAGTLALNPGVGFNGTLVSPDTLDVVVRALSTSGRAKVLSAPRILVNDNASGTLASIAEAPFTSVNASNTVATTSFAGYASAGTTITVTPHISEGDHLQLNYSITLNSFTGQASDGVPPPRQTNTVASEVTIPDGYAIIAGGLRRRDASESRSYVPGLGDIPLLGLLFGTYQKNQTEQTLFVFIRPIILRDDNFEDLKYLSEQDLATCGLPSNYPRSEPRPMD